MPLLARSDCSSPLVIFRSRTRASLRREREGDVNPIRKAGHGREDAAEAARDDNANARSTPRSTAVIVSRRRSNLLDVRRQRLERSSSISRGCPPTPRGPSLQDARALQVEAGAVRSRPARRIVSTAFAPREPARKSRARGGRPSWAAGRERKARQRADHWRAPCRGPRSSRSDPARRATAALTSAGVADHMISHRARHVSTTDQGAGPSSRADRAPGAG